MTRLDKIIIVVVLAIAALIVWAMMSEFARYWAIGASL